MTTCSLSQYIPNILLFLGRVGFSLRRDNASMLLVWIVHEYEDFGQLTSVMDDKKSICDCEVSIRRSQLLMNTVCDSSSVSDPHLFDPQNL